MISSSIAGSRPTPRVPTHIHVPLVFVPKKSKTAVSLMQQYARLPACYKQNNLLEIVFIAMLVLVA